MQLLIPTDDALRRNNFNSLRLIFALLVVLSHSFALRLGTEEGEPLSRLTAGTYNSGNLGVLAFFTISGFLISLSYQRSSWWGSYLGKRVARIVPGYVVAISLCSLVVVPAFSSRAFGDLSPAEWRGLLSNLLLRNYIIYSDAFDGGTVNGSLWSISYEFWCYLGILGVGLTGLLGRRSLFPLVAAAAMALRLWMDLSGNRPGGGAAGLLLGFPYFWVTVLPPFALGAAALGWRDRLPRSGWLLAALGGAVLVAAHMPIADPWRTAGTHLLFPPALAYGIFYIGFHPKVRLGDAARFGDISYGCYLYAFPIQQMLRFGFGGQLGLVSYILLSMLLSLAAGAASWLLVERWFEVRRLRRRRSPLEKETLLAAP